MKKLLIVLGTSIALIFGVGWQQSTVNAKSRIKILSSQQLDSAQSYKITEGYLYSSPKLTHKIHNAKNYQHTTFYSDRSVTVYKPYNAKSVYYHIFNKNKTVSGWTWHGNLIEGKSYNQEKSDISASIGIINTMDSSSRGGYLSELNDINLENTYSNTDAKDSSGDIAPSISSIVDDIGNDYFDPDSVNYQDLAVVGQFYDLFKGRFTTFQREKLDADYQNYQETLNKDIAISSNPANNDDTHEGTDDYLYGLNNNANEDAKYDAHIVTSDFANILSEDIASLQK